MLVTLVSSLMHKRLQRRFFPWIFFHSVEYWYYYIGAGTCLYFLNYFSSEIPLLAKNLGDSAMAGSLEKINIGQFFLLAFYILFFRSLSRLLFFYPARIQQKNLRMELVQRLENSPPRNYKSYTEGSLFQTMYNDLNRIRGFVGFALLHIGNIAIAAYIFIPKINSFNPNFLIAFSPLLVAVIIFSILIFVFQPWTRRSMDEYAEVQNFLLESYEAKKTIQNYNSENDFRNLFNDLSLKELRTFYISSFGRAISSPLVKLGVGASLLWAALIVKNNDLAASDLIFFSSFLFLVLEPLMLLSWIGIVSSQGYAAWSRIKELVTSLDRVVDDEWIRNGTKERLDIPFWESSLSMSIMPQKWTILIGETGCGKSWVMEQFALFLGQNKISYSMIHQEPYLYNDTLIENIFLGNDKTEEKVTLAKKYLLFFGLDILASDMDKLLELELGENGKRVSGGQAKRICLIRSLVTDVDYILWDDPFSSVDLLLENQIILEMRKDQRLKEKTFVLSSHRFSTVKASDAVIYLDRDDGIILGGKTSDIINKNSLVDKFFEKQNI